MQKFIRPSETCDENVELPDENYCQTISVTFCEECYLNTMSKTKSALGQMRATFSSDKMSEVPPKVLFV